MDTKNSSPLRRSLRRIAWILTAVVAGCAVFVFIRSDELVQRAMNRYLFVSAGNEYQLTFSSIHANFITGSIEMDSVRLETLKNEGKRFSFSANQLHVRGISLRKLLFDRQLVLKHLLLDKPVLEAHSDLVRGDSHVDEMELRARLSQFFGERLKSLSIEEISLLHASVQQYKIDDQLALPDSIPDFQIGIEQFYLDSQVLARQEHLFRAGEIYFRISNFHRLLGDSLHLLSVDDLVYSVRRQSIIGRQIHLFPVDSVDVAATCYWIDVPEVRLHAGNLRDILVSDTIRLDSLVLHDSHIRIKPSKNNDGLSFREINKFDLYQLARNDFKQLNVRHLLLGAKYMHIAPRSGQNKSSQEFCGLQVEVSGFRLDSLSGNEPDKILYSDRVSLSVDSYLLRLNDEVHQLEVDHIFVSSNDSLIRAENLRMEPLPVDHRLPVTVQVHCDSIRLRHVDLPRLFHTREMPLREVVAFQPDIKLRQLAYADGNDHDGQSLLYHFIRDYVSGIYANVVAVEGGRFQLDDLRNKADTGNVSTQFDFRLIDFSLDSVSAHKSDKLFYATNFALTFRAYDMKLADQLHRLEVDEISVSSEQQSASIKNFQLLPDHTEEVRSQMRRLKRSERYRISIPRMYLRNTDIHHAFFRKKLNVNQFVVDGPDVYFEIFANLHRKDTEFKPEEFYELLSNYITDIDIKKVSVPNGKIHLVSHSRRGKTIDLTNKFSLDLDHFVLNDNELENDRLLFADQFDLRIKDHLFQLSDKVHYLQASEIRVSSQTSGVSIRKALLYPDITSPEYARLPWHIQVGSPEILLEHVDLHQAYFNRVLNVGNVTINSPVVEVYRNSKSSGKLNFSDISVPLPEEIQELNVNRVALNEGFLKIYNMNRFQKNQIVGAHINFEIEGAGLKREKNTSTARFSSGSIETAVSDLHLTPENGSLEMDVADIGFSSTKKQLTFSGLDIQFKQSGNRNPIRQIRVPLLRFDQLDPKGAFRNNRFHADRIWMEKPVFCLNVVPKKVDGNPFRLKLPYDFQMVMDELSAREVLADGAEFRIADGDEMKVYDQIDLKLDGFRLDSVLSDRALGAQNLTVKKKNYRFSDKNKLYDVLIDRIAYAGSSQSLAFSGIYIRPRYSKDEFQQKVAYQSDYYSGKIGQVVFSGIDAERWFTKKELTGKQLSINKAEFDIYRDKRTPFNEKQRPPLPQQLIQSMELPFYVDSVTLKNSALTYFEQQADMPAPGMVRFSQLNLSLTPVTNLPYLTHSYPVVNLSASAMLMDASQLKVDMTFRMDQENYPFTVSGSLSPFDLKVLNPITENSASILLRSGQLNRFDFEFAADMEKASGKLRFAYDDLKISILEQKNGSTKEARFSSFLANSLMLKSKNPRTRFLLPDDIAFRRDPKKSIINYWWKAVFSGAKNTFGMKEEKE